MLAAFLAWAYCLAGNLTSSIAIDMDTSRIGSDTVVLLSQIVGQPLRHKDLSPPIVFLAPLVSVLTGVMFADNSITNDEKQRWQNTIKRFIPSGQSAVQLTQQLSKGIRAQKIYARPSELCKLAQPLSISERLLLFGLGYEMAVADGQMDELEKQYLRSMAKHMNLNSSHLSVLEASFTGQIADQSALKEVRSLLDPARFHDLETMFVNAANSLLTALPAQSEQAVSQSNLIVAYKQLEAFQQRCVQLDKLCFQAYSTIQACTEKSYLTEELLQVIYKASQKLQSQRFRVSVVGEFSQGKSTLLNALLGEEIQPTRAIPCSGAVTILRYGSQKRVICRYKGGREIEIPVDKYKEKAAIPREVAQEQRLENLADSDLDEIVFEHPSLALCKSGVEIVDSPGLNEHPDRTAITQKLLQDTDAVIFLTNAMRLLPAKEKELLHDVQLQLNGNQDKQPVNNLFLLVNFIDLLEESEDRKDVAQRLEGFIKNENLMSTEGRVHYISAKGALKARLQGIEDEHLHTLRNFTQALEEFLTFERGALKIVQVGRQINHALEAGLNGLAQAELLLDGKVNLSEAEQQKVLNQIGEVSGRDVKIRIMADQLAKQVSDQAVDSWNAWIENLAEKMAQKSVHWNSEHSPVWSQKQMIQDYTDQFVRDLSQEIDEWSNIHFTGIILEQNLKLLDAQIHSELEAIQHQFKQIDLQVDTEISKQLNLAITGIDDEFTGVAGFLGGVGAGGVLAGALLLFTPIGLVATAAAAVAATVAGTLGFGMMDLDGLREQIKNRVFEMGFQRFDESRDAVLDKLTEIIDTTFEQRVETTSRVIAQAIALYENLVEQHEKSHAATLEEREQQKAWILQERQKLEQTRQKIQDILNDCALS